MALDWNGRAAGRAIIMDKRSVGAGIELDIRFPGNAVGVSSIDYTSSGAAGQGTLAGLDVSAYQALALKFTLVSVNGQSDPNFPLELAVGSIIGPAGDGKLSSCEPVVLGFAPERATKVAATPMRTGKIRVIGVHAHVANPKVWDIQGGVVTLRVEPAADAEILPSPVVDRTSVRSGQKSHSMKAASARPETAQTSKPASRTRTKSLSSPAIGTTHIGAW
jgi:hypothetical protein